MNRSTIRITWHGRVESGARLLRDAVGSAFVDDEGAVVEDQAGYTVIPKCENADDDRLDPLEESPGSRRERNQVALPDRLVAEFARVLSVFDSTRLARLRRAGEFAWIGRALRLSAPHAVGSNAARSVVSALTRICETRCDVSPNSRPKSTVDLPLK